MTHIITSLCLRDSGCVDVCPVECIVPGTPQEKSPWFYIDPDTCIDCGACVPECPYSSRNVHILLFSRKTKFQVHTPHGAESLLTG